MATARITAAQQKKIQQLAAKGLSNRAIGLELGLHNTTVMRYINAPRGSTAGASPEVIEAQIRGLLKTEPLTAGELAKSLGLRVSSVREMVGGMMDRGVMLIQLPGGAYDISTTGILPPGRFELKGQRGDWTHHFGFTTDNHLCNKHSRLDVLKAAYSHFERVGITTVFNAGNWIDGEARFNKSELITAPGMDNQLDYMIDKWPVHKGITTHYIAGDDHEGWYAQREGIEIGRYLQSRAKEQGRDDLHYLGYGECDVALLHGAGSAAMRVVHPGGGSAYAISYTDQKRVESYQGGEKPHVELGGHYHKFNFGYPREVWTIQGGCTEDQTMFMRKKRLAAHVGFSEIKLKQDARGDVTQCSVQFFPFFDRGYYERRFK
jgi:predicted transcriptional regulator